MPSATQITGRNLCERARGAGVRGNPCEKRQQIDKLCFQEIGCFVGFASENKYVIDS